MRSSRGTIDVGLLLGMSILFALALLVFSLPMILQHIGLREWGDLIDQLQHLDKYEGTGASLSLPTYIEYVRFIHGDDEQKCEHPSPAICSLCTNLEGNTFISIIINKESKPTYWTILGDALTLKINKAKADGVKLALTDMCFPKGFESTFMNSAYMENGVLVLKGDANEEKKYCVTPEKSTDGMKIYVTEGKCKVA